MNGKKSFLLYADLLHTIRHLTDEQAGQLFKHLLAYVNDENPVLENALLKVAFEPIKQSLKRDLRKYKEIKEKRSEAGKKSAEARKNKALRTKLTLVKSVEQNATNSTVNVNDNVSVNVNDTKKEKGKRKSGVRFSPPSPQQVDEYFLESGLDFEESKRESEKFCNYYESKGWLVGKVKMKSWKGAAANWLKRYQEYKKEKSSAKKEKSELTQQLEQRYGIN